jgi:hypothetical protein
MKPGDNFAPVSNQVLMSITFRKSALDYDASIEAFGNMGSGRSQPLCVSRLVAVQMTQLGPSRAWRSTGVIGAG